jgi:hypothetical protein
VLIVGTVAKLSFTDVIAFVVPFNTNTFVAPAVTVGVAVPPELLNVKLFNTLFPVSVNTPPPLMVTLLVDAIAPFATAEKVNALPVALEGRESVNCVAESTDSTRAPAAMFVPEICIPGTTFAVLATVTIGDALVVAPVVNDKVAIVAFALFKIRFPGI